jgi:hypothetical protein
MSKTNDTSGRKEKSVQICERKMYKYITAGETVGVAEHIIKMDCREVQRVGS